MWARDSFSILALNSHRQVIAREYGAESWHHGTGGSPSAHLSNGCHPRGHKREKREGARMSYLRLKKSGTSSLTVSCLADCLIFCGGLHDTSNLES